MKRNESIQAESFLKNRKRHDHLRRAIALMSAFVMLFTMNTLKRSADTLEHLPMCHMEEHEHTELCYDEGGNLICLLPEHVHTDACYQERPVKEEEEQDLDALVAASDDDLTDAEPEDDGEADPAEDAAVEEVLPFVLGESAMLSEIIEAMKLPVALKDVVAVGPVENDKAHEGLLLAEVQGNDYRISALRDFADAELALILVNGEIETVMLADGKAAVNDAAEVEIAENALADAENEEKPTEVEGEATETGSDEAKQTEVEGDDAQADAVVDAQADAQAVETVGEADQAEAVEAPQKVEEAEEKSGEAETADEAEQVEQADEANNGEVSAIEETKQTGEAEKVDETDKADESEAQPAQAEETVEADKVEETEQADETQKEEETEQKADEAEKVDESVKAEETEQAEEAEKKSDETDKVDEADETNNIEETAKADETVDAEDDTTDVTDEATDAKDDATVATGETTDAKADEADETNNNIEETAKADETAAAKDEAADATDETADEDGEALDETEADGEAEDGEDAAADEAVEEQTRAASIVVDLSSVDLMEAATVEGDTVNLSVAKLLSAEDDTVNVEGELEVDHEEFANTATVTGGDTDVLEVQDGVITLSAEALERGSLTLQTQTETVEEDVTTVTTQTVDIELTGYTGRTTEEIGGDPEVQIVPAEGNSLPADAFATIEKTDVPADMLEAESVEGVMENAVAYDISVRIDNENQDKISNTGDVAVTVTPKDLNMLADVPAGATVGNLEYKLYHIHDDGTCEEVKDAEFDVAEDGTVNSVTFNTDSFSTYIIKYTVDFEYTDPETGRTITWRWPGEGVYNLADIMAKIGASGRIKEATLSRIIDMGGDENVLRLVHQDGAWYLTSEKAFQDTFELTVVTVDIDGGHEKNYNFIITDDPLNQGVTANTYFITPTGSYTSATAESGQTLTASIALTNSNTETGSNAYVRVDIAMDPSVQKKGYWPNDGQQASIVIQNLNGDPTVINYTYHENGGHPYILYEVPAGATAVAKLNFATPNGTTPDGTKVTLTPSIANSDGSYATPASNDKVSAPAVGTWEAEFGWDDIDKRVSAEQVHLTKDNKLTDWLKYDFTANTQNAGDTGEIWTNGVLLTDTLTLPEGMTFKSGSYSVQPASTGYNLVDGSSNIVFGLSKLGGLDIQSVNIQVASDRKSLTYTIDARNPKCTGSTVTAEMDNINYQAELDLGALEMTSEFVEGLSDTNIPAIKNSVNVTETSIFNQTETSKDEVQTVVKGNDGYTVHKTSNKENNPVVKPGDQITYTVTLTNTGNTAFTAENKLEDVLPQAVELDTSSITVSIGGSVVQDSGISYDSGSRKLTCPAQELGANQTLTVTYTVTVKDVTQLQYMPSGSTIDNTATYRDARSYTSYTLEKGHYTVNKAVSGTAGSDKAHAVADGGQVTYTLTATADTGDVSPIIMEDTLPPYLKLLNVTAPNGTPITDLDAYRQSAAWGDSTLWDHSNGDYLKVKIGSRDAFVNVNNGYVTIRYVRNAILSNGSSDTFTYTVQFDASKADDAANEGYVYYDNTVTTPIGETDHADFYGKFGELGVDKQIVSASKDGVPAIGPYENETVLTYSVTVTNNTENPYTKPTFTVTDELPAGLFPVVDNESYKTKAALDAALKDGTNDFTINGEQVNIVKNGGGYKLTWTISNNPRISSITLRYPAQIDTTDVTLNAAGYAALVNTVKVPGASDQEIAEVKEPGLEMDKIATRIVNGKGSIIDDRHVLIQKGSQVTYTLTLTNPTAKDIVATNVYDYFPVWLNNGSLQQSNNYWSTSNVSVSGEFEGHHAGGNTMSINNNRVEFGSVRVPANTTLTETVTLTFPTNIELYQALLVQEGSNSFNRFHVDGLDDAVVDHTMENDEKFYLQKGVVRFDKRVDGSGSINHDQQNYTSVNSSRDIYRRDDVNEVTYYVVLANTGGTNLHVDEFVDYLPDSLELLNTIKDPSQNFNTQEGHCTTTNAFSNCFVYDNGVLEQNNTTDWLDEEGTNHQGNQGIPLAWDNTTGKITFNLNSGKGVTIAPKHVVMFYFRCKIKDQYIDRTDIDAITNSVQAVLDGEPDIKRTSIKENQGAGNSAIQNNGGCTIVEREGGKTVAESSVTIHPMDAVVPGIQKTAKQYWEFESNEKGYKTDAVALRADHNQNIKSQSKVEWEIVLRNDGTEDMTHGYTVTDYIPVGHRITRTDAMNSGDNVFVTSYVIYDQNNTALRTIPVTDAVFTGASIEGTSTTGYKATFTFPDGTQYQIPAGGYAVMKLVSDFIEGWDYQGRIDNEAAFYPNGEWNANLVRNGELIKNDDGTAYTGVKASDYVNAFGEMATSSNKKVEEVEDASNSAYGYEAKNTITVPHGTKRVKYTLQVTDLAESAIDRLVMIDRLPEIGDTGVNNLNNQRGSEFSIGLPSNLVVKVKGPGDHVTEHTLVNGTHYKVQYSTKVAFDDEDYNASFTNDIGTGWSDTPFTGAKSFRILFDKTAIFNEYRYSDSAFSDGNLIVPKNGGQVKVEFEAPIGEDANPGETAYNSFGYRYYTMNSGSTYLQAEPPKVGVRIEPQPALQKRVLDENDQNMGGDATNLFQFSIYAWPTTGELAAKTEVEVQEALANKTPEQVASLLGGAPVFTAEVPQGGSVDLPRQVREDGTARVIFEDGKKYIVVEQAKPGYYSDGYEIGGLKKSQANVAVFTYSVTENTVVVAVNKEDVSGFTPMAYKALVTRDSAALTADRFSFRLQEYTDDTYTTTKGEPLTATNAADGKVEFAKIDYTEASTHYYRMSEVVGNETGIIYDQTMYNVVVVVTEKGAGRFGAVPTYYKVTGEQTTPEALEEGQVPQFVNTESTEIQVEKVWDGDVKTGEATMVLYRATSVPTDSFVVNVNAVLTNTPVGSANITATFTGEGDTKTVELNNGNNWSGQVALKRGVSYTVSYTTNKTDKIQFTSETEVSGITDPTTLTVNANAEAAQQYPYTFTVPEGQRPANGKGSVSLTVNGQQRTLSSANGWTATYTLNEEDTYSYTAIPGDGFVTSVTPESGSGTVSGSQTIEFTLGKADQTMTVPVSVSWDGDVAPDSGNVTVTLTPASGTAQTVILNASNNWSGSFTDIPRLDEGGNLIEYTVSTSTNAESASVSVATPSNGKIRGEGTVVVNGVVNRGMTVVLKKAQTLNWSIDVKVANYHPEYDNNKVDSNNPVFGQVSWEASSAQLSIDNLDILDSSDHNKKYAIPYSNPYVYNASTGQNDRPGIKVTTNAVSAGLSSEYGNKFIWFEAAPGELVFKLEWLGADEQDQILTGQNLSGLSSNALSTSRTLSANSPRRLSVASPRLASNGASGSSGSKKFFDGAVGGSGDAPFTAIQAKDLPAGAEIVPAAALANSTTDAAAATITGDGTLTWDNLPAVDESGNLIYYYVVEKDATANADRMSVRYAYEYNTTGDPASGIRKVTITNTTEKDAPTTGSLTVTKSVNGDDANSTYNIAVKDASGHYYNTDGTDKGTAAFYVTFSMNDSKTWSNLPAGSYTVEEANADAEGYTWSVTGDGNVTVQAGGSASTTVTNTYTPKPGALTITKQVTVGGNEVTDKTKPSLADGEYAFTVAGPDSYSRNITITITNGEARSQTLTNLKPGRYTITEGVHAHGTTLTERSGGTTSRDNAIILDVAAGEEASANVATFTNNRETTPITVTKDWANDVWPEDVTQVVVTLKANGADASVTQADNGNLATVTLTRPTSDNTASATWTNLPVKDTNYQDITYTVEETSVTMVDGNTTVTYTASGDVTLEDLFTIAYTQPTAASSYQATVTNALNETTISVLKQSTATGNPALPGATFTLARKNANGTYENYTPRGASSASATSGPDGTLSFANLPYGDYRLEETGIPAGYARTSSGKYIYFTVDANGVTRTYPENAEAIPSTDNTVAYENLQFTVGNTPGARLPSTGGAGTAPIYAAGAGLLLLAVLGFILSARRKARDGIV